jgi:hypothetical protein
VIARQQQVAAITVQCGDLEREGRVDIDDQVTVGGQFIDIHLRQPVRQRL